MEKVVICSKTEKVICRRCGNTMNEMGEGSWGGCGCYTLYDSNTGEWMYATAFGDYTNNLMEANKPLEDYPNPYAGRF